MNEVIKEKVNNKVVETGKEFLMRFLRRKNDDDYTFNLESRGLIRIIEISDKTKIIDVIYNEIEEVYEFRYCNKKTKNNVVLFYNEKSSEGDIRAKLVYDYLVDVFSDFVDWKD